MKSAFISPPCSFCHASTIVQTPGGFVAAFFAGTLEGHRDVGVWSSRFSDTGWDKPVEVVNGVQPNGRRFPCWNPVLTQPPGAPLMLFYKVGPNCSDWWGMLMISADDGRTWSDLRRLPDGIWGPIKNKPVVLPGGELLCPSSTEHDGWRIHLERTADLGRTWTMTGPLSDKDRFSTIQPTILSYPSGRMQLLCRSRNGSITEVWSEDGGESWGTMVSTSLPNPNSGIDAVMRTDGGALLVYNHTPEGRSPLNVATSHDGVSWHAAMVLEDKPGEFSYPAVIEADDGRIHITYSWRGEKIRHVVIAPDELADVPIIGGKWPGEVGDADHSQG